VAETNINKMHPADLARKRDEAAQGGTPESFHPADIVRERSFAVDEKLAKNESQNLPAVYPSMSEAVLADIQSATRKGQLPGAMTVTGQGLFENFLSAGEAAARMVTAPVGAIVPYLMDDADGTYADAVEAYRDGRFFTVDSQTGMLMQRKMNEFGELAAVPFEKSAEGYRILSELAMGAGIERSVESGQELRQEGIAEGVFQATGSPAAATIAEGLPIVAGASIPRGISRGKLFTRVDRDADVQTNVVGQPGVDEIDAPPGQFGGVVQTERGFRNAKETSDSIPAARRLATEVQDRNVTAVTQAAQPSAATIAAFENLGIKNYSPGMVSESTMFRKVESGRKADPESPLAAIDESVYNGLLEVSEDLINRYGTTARDQLDADIRIKSDAVLDNLKAQADEGFALLRESTDASRSVMPNRTIEMLMKEARELTPGGRDLAEGLRNLAKMPEFKPLVRELFAIDKDGNVSFKTPTYKMLDNLREDVGNRGAASGMQGQSKRRYDMQYSTLVDDLGDANDITLPDGTNLRAVHENAKNLSRQRFELLDAQKRAFGRDGAGETRGFDLTRMDSVVNQLVKGSLEKFEEMMSALPTKEQRAAVQASMIANLLSPGMQRGLKIKKNFVDNLDALDRNPSAKAALFRDLPREAVERFDLISTAYRGYARSKEFDNNSGTANAFMAALREGKFLQRVYGKSADAVRRGTVVTEAKGDKVRGESRVEAGDQFLASKELRNAIREYAADTGKTKRLKELQRSRAFRNWVDTLTEADAKELARNGVMAYLIAEQDDENE